MVIYTEKKERRLTEPLAIFATITPKPEHLQEAKQAVLDIIPDTLREPGCRRFELLEAGTGDRLHLWEIWADDAALEAHYQQPYTREVFEKYKTWLARPVEITRMSPAS